MIKCKKQLLFLLLLCLLFSAGSLYCQSEYTLTILFDVTDPADDPYGNIYVSPPGSTIDMDTSFNYLAGTEVDVTAQTANIQYMCQDGEGVMGYVFNSWEGDWPGDPESSGGTIIMDGNKTITAYYDTHLACPTPTVPGTVTGTPTPPITPLPTPDPTPDSTATPTSTPNPTVPPGTESPLGDVNSDGITNIIDALLIAQFYVNLDVDPFNPDNADVNCDGSITIVDALLVARLYVQLIDELPGCHLDGMTLTVIFQGRDPALPNCDGIALIDPPGEVISEKEYVYDEGTLVNAYTLGSTPPPPGIPWQSAKYEFEGVTGYGFSFVMDRDRSITVIFTTYENPEF